MSLTKKLLISVMLLFLVGCASDVTYRETFLERRSQGTAIPGKIGIRILEPDEKLSLSPSSYTGWATKINFDIGRITKKVALSTYGELFNDGAVYVEKNSKTDDLNLILEPKVKELKFRYNSLKNVGFAVTPQVEVWIFVKVFDTQQELIFEKGYHSGWIDGDTYVINLDYNGAINKTLHVILQDLFAKSFNDFKNKL